MFDYPWSTKLQLTRVPQAWFGSTNRAQSPHRTTLMGLDPCMDLIQKRPSTSYNLVENKPVLFFFREFNSFYNITKFRNSKLLNNYFLYS